MNAIAPIGITLMDLTSSTCRWIVSAERAEETLYCGAPVAKPGCPYCLDHSRRAFSTGKPVRFQCRAETTQDKSLLTPREGRARQSAPSVVERVMADAHAGAETLLRRAMRQRAGVVDYVETPTRIEAQEPPEPVIKPSPVPASIVPVLRPPAGQVMISEEEYARLREYERIAFGSAEFYGPFLPEGMFISRRTGRATWDRRAVIRMVARAAGISVDELVSSRREAVIVGARHIAYWAGLVTTGSSLPEFGRVMGGRDHTTVLHGLKLVRHALRLNRRREPSEAHLEAEACAEFLRLCCAGETLVTAFSAAMKICGSCDELLPRCILHALYGQEIAEFKRQRNMARHRRRYARLKQEAQAAEMASASAVA